FLFEELWALRGRRFADDVELVPLSPFYRLRFADGSTFDCSADPAAMRAEVARLSPGDVAGYERFMRLSEEACRIGFEQLGHVPFDSFSSMVRAAPDLLRLGGLRSVHALVARHVRDERLRVALSFHPLLIGGNPFTASGLYALIAHLERRWGVWWAMGGTGALVRGLVRLVEDGGGVVRLNTDVRRIAVRDGRATGVELASGEAVPAEVVVSNADSAWTYGELLPPEHRRKRWTEGKLRRARHSMGLFVWYFGTRRRYENVGHHTILLGPRYHGLLRDIFARKALAPDFSLYLHRPTATDPSMAPPGCDCFYVLSPVPNLDAGIDWAVEAERYRKAIALHLSDKFLPGLEEAVVTSRVATPRDFRDDLLSPRGAGFGLEPVLWQSAWFRPHNRSEEVENLFLVGAGTHPGAGLPGVLCSAKVLDSLVPRAHAVA
ncbi:MAG: phytoene desaturase, partial [Acetobacteraceae bacterium]|nr:phytoene desaturase [Acetobacteraceae bacterium]